MEKAGKEPDHRTLRGFYLERKHLRLCTRKSFTETGPEGLSSQHLERLAPSLQRHHSEPGGFGLWGVIDSVVILPRALLQNNVCLESLASLHASPGLICLCFRRVPGHRREIVSTCCPQTGRTSYTTQGYINVWHIVRNKLRSE